MDEVFVAYGALGAMAAVSIYAGAHASLMPARFASGDDDNDDDGDDTVFTFDDAKWYPVFGSATLFGMYLLLKYASRDIVNKILTALFVGTGGLAVFEVGELTIRAATRVKLDNGPYILSLDKLRRRQRSSRTRISASGEPERLIRAQFGLVHVALAIATIAVVAGYAVTKHWILSNLFGVSLSISAIKLLRLDSFATGVMLLSGLFAYDVFWVFGTDVMVTVAKGLDVPIKVIFPKNFTAVLEQGIFNEPKDIGFTMLGLGDIVIPGVFVALCLAFDQAKVSRTTNVSAKSKLEKGRRRTVRRKAPDGKKVPILAAPYFLACFFMYVVGLATTVYVMHTYQTAQMLILQQPALLYLSPACIASPLVVALFQRDWKGLWEFKNIKTKD
ncbi:hypothetical protein HDU82_004192 [Entophlyctis luteolus]|nr:hypothetical protein HDU82_004192 [Entophlyctis luteolus]